MELGLSLGDTPKPFPFLHNHLHMSSSSSSSTCVSPNPINRDLGFCMGGRRTTSSHDHHQVERKGSSDPPPLQLDLLPFSPLQRHPQPPLPTLMPQLRFPWLSQNLICEAGKSSLEMNRPQVSTTTAMVVAEEGEDGAALSSSPNSAVSSYSKHQMDFTSMFTKRKRDFLESKSDEEDVNGFGRKKLRLTKDQSAFLEDSFKEHNTLNPKQKLALAKQLNLRPRQVEVWFQNRRARTKLKQTEVDCEYLKRCCETLTEENRRLQKEVQELRALKSSKPFYMQLPATTLTMCPSCERVASTSATTTAATTITASPATITTITATTNTALSLASTRSNS